MGCFRCSGESSLLKKKKNRNNQNNSGYHRCAIHHHDHAQTSSPPPDPPKQENKRDAHLSVLENTAKETAAAMENTASNNNSSNGEAANGKPRAFRYSELVAATHNFKFDNFLGEGGFGSVYKGCLKDTGEIVAIKQLDRYGFQGSNEFLIEVFTLCNAKHPNLIKLIGYCVEGNHFLLVYECMPLGSLEDHLYDASTAHKKPLDWNTRMKILAGSARGLEYLHDEMKPPIIYRDLKCSNILLDDGYKPKLSDFGLAKVCPKGDMTHVSTRVMGTYGYCAPDYAATGQLTFKSDIYSFGVVLLEIISGRRAIDNTRPGPEQNLVEWAKPIFKDRTKFHLLADPALEGRYSVKGLYQAISIAAICLQEKASMRPQISELVSALNYIVAHEISPRGASAHRSTSHNNVPPQPRANCSSSSKHKSKDYDRRRHSNERFN